MADDRDALLILFLDVDPWHLREMGVPDDEYSPEVDALSADVLPTAEELRDLFIRMGTAPEEHRPRSHDFGVYPAISREDAESLVEGIARIRATDWPTTRRATD